MNTKKFKEQFVDIIKLVMPEVDFSEPDIVATISRKWMDDLDKNTSGSITDVEFYEALSRMGVEIPDVHME